MLRLYVRNRTGTRVLLAQCEQPFNLGIVKLATVSLEYNH